MAMVGSFYHKCFFSDCPPPPVSKYCPYIRGSSGHYPQDLVGTPNQEYFPDNKGFFGDGASCSLDFSKVIQLSVLIKLK